MLKFFRKKDFKSLLAEAAIQVSARLETLQDTASKSLNNLGFFRPAPSSSNTAYDSDIFRESQKMSRKEESNYYSRAKHYRQKATDGTEFVLNNMLMSRLLFRAEKSYSSCRQ